MNQITTNVRTCLQNLEDLWPRLYKDGLNIILASLISLGGGYRVGFADAAIGVVECYNDFLRTYITLYGGQQLHGRYMEKSRDLLGGVRECVDENSDSYLNLGLRLVNSVFD